MSEYHVKITLANDDKTDLGYMVINAPRHGGTGNWRSFGQTVFASGGKWVVGHAIGKSPQDSYYQDDQQTNILMLASFIPMYDFNPGYQGTGKLLSTMQPTDTQDINFWLYEKDGKNPDTTADNTGSGDAPGDGGGSSDTAYA
jgi:hypothetical protein